MRQQLLENRIPPPIVLIITVLLIWLISRFDHTLELAKPWRWGGAAFFTALGLALDFSSVLLFFKSKTTINPLVPNSTKQLVTRGFFNYSRNPMYLGMVFIALGVACFFASPVSLLAIMGFVYFITKFQIIPEERAMQNIFGEQFVAYQQRVRRWL